MGTQYSIDLYFPKDSIQAALEAIIPHTVHVEKSTTVILPNGKKMTVPYAGEFIQKYKRIDLSSQEFHTFALIMLFPYDAYLEEYEKELLQDIATTGNSPKEIKQEKKERCKVGYIYLSIHCGETYTQFHFSAAVSRMNNIFLKSISLHNVFKKILEKAGGVYGHINIDGYYEYVPIEHPKLFISPQKDLLPAEIGSVDLLVLASLKTLEYQRKQWEKQGDGESFYKKWVEPFREIIVWHEKLELAKAQLAFSTIRPYLHELNENIMDLLFDDTHPLYSEAAVWLIGLSQDRKYLPKLSELARKDWFLETCRDAYCFALVRLGQEIPKLEDWWDEKEIKVVVEELCKLLE